MEVKEQETKELVPQELEVQKPEVHSLISPTLAEKAIKLSSWEARLTSGWLMAEL